MLPVSPQKRGERGEKTFSALSTSPRFMELRILTPLPAGKLVRTVTPKQVTLRYQNEDHGLSGPAVERLLRAAMRERDLLDTRPLGPGHHRLQCLLPRRLLDPASARNISVRRSPFALVW